MKPDDIADRCAWKGEPTRAKIALDNGAMGTFGPFPDPESKRRRIIVRYNRARRWDHGTPSIPWPQTKGSADMISTSEGIVASERVHNEPVTGVGVEFNREAAIRPAMAGPWCQHAVTADRLAAEGKSDSTSIDHGYARRLRLFGLRLRAAAQRFWWEAISVSSHPTARQPGASWTGWGNLFSAMAL
jgi:hypothetical protein